MSVLDYSSERPGGAAVRNARASGVVRYCGALTGSFNLTRGEVDDLHANGLAVAVVVEQRISAIVGGRQAGRNLAAAGRAGSRAAGLPDGLSYYAADADFSLSGAPVSPQALGNMAAIADTLAGAKDVTGPGSVGFYGDVFIIDWLRAERPGLVDAYWQTEAWSHGLHHAAVLYQRATPPAGTPARCDFNDQLGDWRPRGYPATQPPPRPLPVDVFGIQRTVGAVPDGIWGKDTDRRTELVRLHGPNLRDLQVMLGVPSDGVWGPVTAAAYTRDVHGIQSGLRVVSDGTWGPVTQAAYLAADPMR